MALKRGEEHFTMFSFSEDHDGVNRRVHRITLQDRTGKVHILEGKALPHKLTLDTGKARKGNHVAEILLKPESASSLFSLPEGEIWPSRRDVAHGLVGIALFVLMQRFAIQLASVHQQPASLTQSAFALPPHLPGSENNRQRLDPVGSEVVDGVRRRWER